MNAVIRKWGNSPALRLSVSLMETVGLALDQKVTVKARRGRIVIEPVRRAVYSLDDLAGGEHVTTTEVLETLDRIIRKHDRRRRRNA